jgi:putative CocE/NonD family hydrolase
MQDDAATAPLPPDPAWRLTETITITRDVSVSLADGTVTRAEVWTAPGTGPRPAILVRTPYGKEIEAHSAITDPRLAVRRGFAIVFQDVRGRGTSDGEFEPFATEERDGADSVAWVAAQEWCDGRVVMSGASYVGATQWLAAAAAPPALAAIAPVLSSDDAGQGWSFNGAVPEQGFLTTWSATYLASGEPWFDAPERAYEDHAGLATIAPWIPRWLDEPAGTSYWRGRSVAHRRADVVAPTLVVAGWYDIFLAGSLASFARSRDPRDRLVIGPWGHDAALSHLVGDANAGAAGSGEERLFGWTLDFYDAILAGRDVDLPRVSAYVVGARRWLALESWPPPGTRTLALPLDGGTVTVSREQPVPSLGGRGLLCGVPGSGFGARDQRELLDRADVHVCLRTRLSGPTLLSGPVRARLEIVPIDSHAAMWALTLCVAGPGEALHNIADGVVRVEPGADHVTVDLGDVAIEIAEEQELVLLAAGSSFPRWPRPAASGPQYLHAASRLELTLAPAGLAGSTR